MWMFSFIPDAVLVYLAHALLIAGIGGLVVGVVTNRFVIKIVSSVVFAVALFLQGFMFANEEWIEQVKLMQDKVAAAEEKSKQQNAKIVEKLNKEVEAARGNSNENKQIIKEFIAEGLDAQCTLPNSAVMLHDSASQNEISRGARDTDGRASDVKASEVLETVVDNYGTCYEMRSKLLGWQEWYKTQKQIYDGVK